MKILVESKSKNVRHLTNINNKIRFLTIIFGAKTQDAWRS